MLINSCIHPLKASPCPSVNSGPEWDCRPGVQCLSADFPPEVSEFWRHVTLETMKTKHLVWKGHLINDSKNDTWETNSFKSFMPQKTFHSVICYK